MSKSNLFGISDGLMVSNATHSAVITQIDTKARTIAADAIQSAANKVKRTGYQNQSLIVSPSYYKTLLEMIETSEKIIRLKSVETKNAKLIQDFLNDESEE